jgi:signal peptidase II
VILARRAVQFAAVSIPSIGLDQWTKVLATAHLKGQPPHIWLGDTFRLQYATNEGAFLSLGAQLPPQARYWVLIVGVGVLLAALAAYALFSRTLDRFQVGAYALIASGGFSNWIDRARFDGLVVDFMNMGIGWLRTGVFNVADLAIMVGIGLLFLHSYRQDKAAKAAAAEERTTSS